MPRRFALDVIIAFKAVKATLLSALGIGLLVSRHRDPVATVWSIAQAVHLPATSRAFARLTDLAFQITPGRTLSLAITAFGYAALMGSEGVALYLRRPWARWFTIIATSSLVPVELYEIFREVHPIRVVILVVNVGVVIYLWRRKEM